MGKRASRPAAAARVLPALFAPLPRVRFDFRFHIAHALGRINALVPDPAAQAALKDLADRDPFAPVRELAADMLKTPPPPRGAARD